MQAQPSGSGIAVRLSIAAILIAFASAAVAGLNVYTSFFSPFSPNLTFGMAAWRVLAPPLSSATPIIIAVPILVTNTGAKSGCISDFAIRLTQTATKAKWFLFPTFYVDYARYLKLQATGDAAGKKTTVPPVEQAAESTFYPPFILARTSEARTILFAPRPPLEAPTHILAVKDVRSDQEFEITLLWRQCGDSGWRAATSHSAEFDNQDLNDLRKGIAVVPLYKEYDGTREDLMRRF